MVITNAATQIEDPTGGLGLVCVLADKSDTEGVVSSLDLSVKISQAANKDRTYRDAFNDRVVVPVQDFYQKVEKGDFKATLTLLGIVTIARYILLQKTWLASGMAAAQVAAISPFLAAHGLAILSLVGAAGLASRLAPHVLAYMRGQTNAPASKPSEMAQRATEMLQRQEQGRIARFREGVRASGIVVVAGGATYAGHRLTIEGNGRVEAALRESGLSDKAQNAVRVSLIAVPAAVGTGVAYGALRTATPMNRDTALITAGAAGSAYALYRGYRYFMQVESAGEAVVRKEVQSAIQSGETTPVWEMTKGAIEITAGAALCISSSALLNATAGAVVASGITGAATGMAERDAVAAWDRETGPSLTAGLQEAAEASAVQSLAQTLTSWLV